jgi:raw score 10.28
MPCGVLSEDLVFNASTEHHSLAIEYLKVVAKVLDQAKD